jgi:hypothetical protein
MDYEHSGYKESDMVKLALVPGNPGCLLASYREKAEGRGDSRGEAKRLFRTSKHRSLSSRHRRQGGRAETVTAFRKMSQQMPAGTSHRKRKPSKTKRKEAHEGVETAHIPEHSLKF